MKSNVTATLKKIANITTGIALSLFVGAEAFAATTVLTFDNLPVGSYVGTQYSGVSFNSPIVIQSQPNIPAQSGTQLAFSEEGIMDISFSIANIQTVSGYVSSDAGVVVTIFSASSTILGQAVLNPGANQLFSLTSSSLPIARLVIDGGGVMFGLDTLTFETAVTIPVCEAINQNLYNSVSAAPLSIYKVAKTASTVRAALLKAITCFDQSLKSDASNKVLLSQLAALRAAVDLALKSSPEKTSILQMIDSFIAKTKAGQC